MIKIIPVERPKDASESYQFFEVDGVEGLWKASIVKRISRPVMLTQAEVETAPAELGVTITVSPVDEDGKALREDDKPIIIEPYTHNFTSADMCGEDFNPAVIIGNIIAERIEAGISRMAGINKINNVINNWSKPKLNIKGTSDECNVPPNSL